jgi:hypothetical protein
VPHRLRIFISSSSDLKAERDAVESVLADMDIDGERFESWPSSPNHPIKECLQRVEESDAVILLLGKKYGTPSPVKSGTHLEYDHAKALHPTKPLRRGTVRVIHIGYSSPSAWPLFMMPHRLTPTMVILNPRPGHQ